MKSLNDPSLSQAEIKRIVALQNIQAEKVRKERLEKKHDKKKVEGFLKGLQDLSKKYGYAVGGCGCCGSPYLYQGEPDIKHLRNTLD